MILLFYIASLAIISTGCFKLEEFIELYKVAGDFSIQGM
jgi:hypothetical protein